MKGVYEWSAVDRESNRLCSCGVLIGCVDRACVLIGGGVDRVR